MTQRRVNTLGKQCNTKCFNEAHTNTVTGDFVLASGKSRTVGRSFRIEERWLNALSRQAEKERTSLNSLVNRVLQDYTMFGTDLRNFPSVDVSQEFLSRVIACLPKEQIQTMVRQEGEKAFCSEKNSGNILSRR